MSFQVGSFKPEGLVLSAFLFFFGFSYVADAQNIIESGDFESGVTGFTSDYINYTGQIDRTGFCPGYGNPCTMERGQFAIGTNANEYNIPLFTNLGDYTTGNHNYFIADASGDTTQAPWKSSRTIAVTSTTQRYRFAVYIANINGDNAHDLPALSFEIGDGANWVRIGSTGFIPNGSGWRLVEQNVNFTGTGLFYVRLLNASTGEIGNDFGLNDVSFTECPSCVAVQTVDLGALNTGPTAEVGPDQTGVASGTTVTLAGTGSSDPDFGDTLSYAWTQTSGVTVSLSSATASQPSFTAPVLGASDAAVTLTFSLVVTDNKGNVWQ